MSKTRVRSTAGLDVGSLGRQAAAAMLARTIVMRGVTAAGTVVLARILVPADFGVYAVLVLVQNVLMFFADFGLGPSLVQQESDPTRQEMATAWLMQQLVWIVVAAWLVAGGCGEGTGFLIKPVPVNEALKEITVPPEVGPFGVGLGA